MQRIGLKWFTLLLLIVAVIFIAFENRSQGLTFSGASPYNYGWDGTSNFARYLAKNYGDVVLISRWVDSESIVQKYHQEYSCKLMIFVSPEKKYEKDEVKAIAKLFEERGFNIAILDEGPYTNDILMSLGVPVEINAFNYVKVYKYAYGYIEDIVPGHIDIDRRYDTVFSYTSPISIYNQSLCTPIAYAAQSVVGALCRFNLGSVFILGDGSIVTNAAIPSIDKINMYTIIVDSFINTLCKGNVSKVMFLIESSRYNLRPLTLEEMIGRGYSSLKALGVAFNPFRNLYAYTAGDNSIPLPLLLITLVVVIVVSVLYRRQFLEYGEVHTSIASLYGSGYGKETLMLIVSKCRENVDCVNVLPCVAKKRIGNKCIKELNKYLSKDRLFRRRILETFLSTSTATR